MSNILSRNITGIAPPVAANAHHDIPFEPPIGQLIPPLADRWCVDEGGGWEERIYFEQKDCKAPERRPVFDSERAVSETASKEWAELSAPPCVDFTKPVFHNVKDFRSMLLIIMKDPLVNLNRRLVIKMLGAVRSGIWAVRKHLWHVMQTGDIPKGVINATNAFGFRSALQRVLLDLVKKSHVKLKGLSNLPPIEHRDPEVIKYMNIVDDTAERHQDLLLAIAAVAKKLKLQALHLMRVKNRGTGMDFEHDEIPDEPDKFIYGCIESWDEDDAAEGYFSAA